MSVSRRAAGIFAVFYGDYDTVAAIATGIAQRNARGFSGGAQAAVYEAVKVLPRIGDSVRLLRDRILNHVAVGAGGGGVYFE